MDSSLTETGGDAHAEAGQDAEREDRRVTETAGSANDGDDRRRVEELLRVNERLAAEVRSLAGGRIDAPRLGATASSRRLGAVTEERDRQALRIGELEAQLAASQEHAEALEAHREALDAEVARLRHGWRGTLRRLRARLSPR